MIDLKEIHSLRLRHASKIEFAHYYSQKNLLIFPVNSIENGKCSCGFSNCSSPGKHPLRSLAPNGFKSAASDYEIIHKWWMEFPRANIGLVTGHVNGISVLDFDVKNGGVNLFNHYLKEQKYLSHCLKADSGGRGVHCVLKYDSRLETTASKKPGLDIRSDGGYILIEPSNHISGGEYRWRL